MIKSDRIWILMLAILEELLFLVFWIAYMIEAITAEDLIIRLGFLIGAQCLLVLIDYVLYRKDKKHTDEDKDDEQQKYFSRCTIAIKRNSRSSSMGYVYNEYNKYNKVYCIYTYTSCMATDYYINRFRQEIEE